MKDNLILHCLSCGETLLSPPPSVGNCPQCGGILHVQGYVYDRARLIDSLDAPEGMGIWRFHELLPVERSSSWTTLGEGNTPLHRMIVDQHLYIKDETRNPTGSFKDRATAVAVSAAREAKAQGVLVASSGNAGASAAAYATAAGLGAVVLVPEGVPAAKLVQIHAYGACVLRVAGDYSNSFSLADQLVKQTNWANVTTTYLNPFGLEGDKTVAYELNAQLSGRIPDWILIPVGAGPLLAGVYRGYQELKQMGMVSRLPRMIAVQSSGCAPIVEAFEAGRATVEAWEHPEGIASGILDPLRGYPQDGSRTLSLVRESGGLAVSVSDEELLLSVVELGRRGIFAEPAGAAGYAAVRVLRDHLAIGREDLLVALVTGSGFKNMGPLAARWTEEQTIPPRVDVAIAALAERGVRIDV